MDKSTPEVLAKALYIAGGCTHLSKLHAGACQGCIANALTEHSTGFVKQETHDFAVRKAVEYQQEIERLKESELAARYLLAAILEAHYDGSIVISDDQLASIPPHVAIEHFYDLEARATHWTISSRRAGRNA